MWRPAVVELGDPVQKVARRGENFLIRERIGQLELVQNESRTVIQQMKTGQSIMDNADYS